jgi:hypothetical protein
MADDDWFSSQAGSTRTPAATADDWTSEEAAVPTARPRVEAPPTRRVPSRRVLVVGLAVVILAVAGVVAALAFTGGEKRASPPATIAPTTTVQRTTTTTTTTTTPRGASPAAPTTTLKPGDTGAQVKLLQRFLRLFGYSKDKVDGVYGPSTEAAVKRFQQASKLTADGIVGPATLKALKQALGSR